MIGTNVKLQRNVAINKTKLIFSTLYQCFLRNKEVIYQVFRKHQDIRPKGLYYKRIIYQKEEISLKILRVISKISAGI